MLKRVLKEQKAYATETAAEQEGGRDFDEQTPKQQQGQRHAPRSAPHKGVRFHGNGSGGKAGGTHLHDDGDLGDLTLTPSELQAATGARGDRARTQASPNPPSVPVKTRVAWQLSDMRKSIGHAISRASTAVVRASQAFVASTATRLSEWSLKSEEARPSVPERSSSWAAFTERTSSWIRATSSAQPPPVTL